VIFLQYISLSNVNFFFQVCYFHGMFCASSKFEWCGVEEVGSGSFSYVKKDTKSKCRMVVIFIKIYKQVIFQHECIVSPVQSASGKAVHCAWHFHRRNSSVLSYYSNIFHSKPHSSTKLARLPELTFARIYDFMIRL
jgi:hypothetical protein